MKRILVNIVLYFLLPVTVLVEKGNAQDLHFSQYYNNPLLLNPALTGTMEAAYRVSSNYKSQWQSFTNAFRTMSFSYDMKLHKKNTENKGLAIGLNFFKDKAGKTEMGINGFNLSLSSKLPLSNQQFLSFGLQGTYTQESISFNDLLWDENFDGFSINTGIPGEQLENLSFSYFDIAAGVFYKFQTNRNFSVNTGYTIRHLSQPDQSFFRRSNDKTYMRSTFHMSTFIGKKGAFNPKLLIQQQGSSFEYLFGMLYHKTIGQDSRYTTFQKSSKIYGGMLYRYNDAVIITVGFDYESSLKFEVSYDTNISTLRKASKYRGGMEFSLIYKGLFEDARIKLIKSGSSN